uniref:SAGA-associated factor 11 n=2 Tax=Lygus hesperus TaxID=30085 RepID=A0A0A9XSE7_LYGHE
MVIMKKWEAVQQDAKLMYEKAKADVKKLVDNDPSSADNFAERVYSKIIDDLLLETVSQYHRAAVKGYADHVFPEGSQPNGDMMLVDDLLIDKRIVEDINCPNCSQLMSPLRFERHLTTCMNLGGRRSSRLASGRVTATSLKEASDPCPSTGTSDDGDDDWLIPFDKSSASHPKKKKMAQKNKNHKKVRFII